MLGQRILCASTKQSSMLRTRGTSGAVVLWKFAKVRSAKPERSKCSITRSGIAGAQELNGVKGRFRVRDCADTGCRQGWVQGGHPGNPMT